MEVFQVPLAWAQHQHELREYHEDLCYEARGGLIEEEAIELFLSLEMEHLDFSEFEAQEIASLMVKGLI